MVDTKKIKELLKKQAASKLIIINQQNRITELENLLLTFKSMFKDNKNDLYLTMIEKLKI